MDPNCRCRRDGTRNTLERERSTGCTTDVAHVFAAGTDGAGLDDGAIGEDVG
jgi:hypothetical protein